MQPESGVNPMTEYLNIAYVGECKTSQRPKLQSVKQQQRLISATSRERMVIFFGLDNVCIFISVPT